MLRRWIFLGLLVGQLAEAFELRRDASGAVVRWRRGVEFVVDADLDRALGEPRAIEAVRAAVETVGAAASSITVEARVGRTGAFGYDAERPAANQSEVLVLEEWPYDETALAVTLLTLDARSHELLDADIAFQAGRYDFRVLDEGTAPSGAAPLNDVQNTVTHELGHALGLMHNEDDSRVVMYPGAAPRETHKRRLATDDRLGLAALYDRAFAETVGGAGASSSWAMPVGCASAPPAAPLGPLLVAAVALGLALRGRRGDRALPKARWMLRVSGRRRRASVVGAGLLGVLGSTAATGGEPGAASFERLLAGSGIAALGRVVDARSWVSEQRRTLIVTELRIDVERCLLGACPERVQLTMPGGRLGDLEQLVVHQPVPPVGALVAVYAQGGRLRVRALVERGAQVAFEAAAARVADARMGSIVPPRGQEHPHDRSQAPESTW